MVCAAPFLEGAERVVLVSHHPISVFATTSQHLARLKKKPDGHYNRADLEALAKNGNAVHYDETAVRDISQAIEILIHGCPPRV
jgi:hypothetical protein